MNVTVINTGGTFNKIYNPITGELDVPTHSLALNKIIDTLHNVTLEVITILSKDSLDMTQEDRDIICKTIQNSCNENIIVIHGTDTMDLTAQTLFKHISNKKIVLTGAMIPMSIDEVEATVNFSLALGFLNALVQNGIYIAMHGSVASFEKISKDRQQGKFLRID
jgi:L-asparaginase